MRTKVSGGSPWTLQNSPQRGGRVFIVGDTEREREDAQRAVGGVVTPLLTAQTLGCWMTLSGTTSMNTYQSRHPIPVPRPTRTRLFSPERSHRSGNNFRGSSIASPLALRCFTSTTMSSEQGRSSTTQRFVDYRNADLDSRNACIRPSMAFGLLLRYHGLPMDEVVRWVNEMGGLILTITRPLAECREGVGTNTGTLWNASGLLKVDSS